jgi:hypothetical protein
MKFFSRLPFARGSTTFYTIGYDTTQRPPASIFQPNIGSFKCLSVTSLEELVTLALAPFHEQQQE